MASSPVKLPPGFVLENQQQVQSQPQLPPGFVLEQPKAEELPWYKQPWVDSLRNSHPQVGAVKGVGSTLWGTADLINKGIRMIPGVDKLVPSFPAKPDILNPRGIGEGAGYLTEQVGEFAAPGTVATKTQKGLVLGSKASAVLRGGIEALGTGAVSAMQGGDFNTGFVAGGIGFAGGQAAKAIAPKIAEAAMGIRGVDRMMGKTPGTTALKEIGGISPAAVASNATEKAAVLTRNLEQAALDASNNGVRASLTPAIDVVDQEMQTAFKRNSASMVKRLKAVREQLTTSIANGMPIHPNTTPEQVLNLKRGIGELISSWSQEEQKGVQKVIKRVYGALDGEIDATVPGAKELNQEISTLITVQKRAGQRANNAGVTQRVLNRVAAHTGAAASTIAGGAYGYKEGGVPGMVVGGAAGLAIPEVLSSPSVQMSLARMLGSPAVEGQIIPFGRGLFLQAFKNDKGAMDYKIVKEK